LTGVHAVVYRKVAADHVGTCGGGVTGECFGGVMLAVGAVFAIVDTDNTGVPVASD
jgi:hypothetical protein